MKNFGKNSTHNKKSSDTLIYISLFISAAIIIGGGLAWHFWPNKEKQWNHDYKEALGKYSSSPTAEEVSKLISENRSRLKTARRIFEGKMRGRTLTAEEKNEVKKELDNVDEKLNELLRGQNLKEMEEDSPDVLATIYSMIYEQGKVTVRLKDKTSVGRSIKELKEQEAFQEEWEISEQEEENIKEKMNDLIKQWYFQARGELIGDEPGKYPLLTEFVIPLWDEGEKIEGKPTQAQINKYKEVQRFRDGKEIDLSKPLTIDFNGFYGFLTKEDKKSSSEGKEVFGLTKSTPLAFLYPENVNLDKKHQPIGQIPPDFHLVKYCSDNHREIEIGFEKKLFFNRLGYEEWLINVTKEGRRTYFDICFEEVVETIAHELAHAIVNTTEPNYEGEEGGGHGEFFYQIMEKIEKMIKDSPEYEGFKTWWEQPESEYKKFQPSASVDDETHLDRWKYWYIGGGVLIMISVVGLVVVFWGEPTKRKNVKI